MTELDIWPNNSYEKLKKQLDGPNYYLYLLAL